jgi:hypothetical protein
VRSLRAATFASCKPRREPRQLHLRAAGQLPCKSAPSPVAAHACQMQASPRNRGNHFYGDVDAEWQLHTRRYPTWRAAHACWLRTLRQLRLQVAVQLCARQCQASQAAQLAICRPRHTGRRQLASCKAALRTLAPGATAPATRASLASTPSTRLPASGKVYDGWPYGLHPRLLATARWPRLHHRSDIRIVKPMPASHRAEPVKIVPHDGVQTGPHTSMEQAEGIEV